MNLSENEIPFALSYQQPGRDERLRAGLRRALGFVGIVVAVIRIGGALTTGQTWMGLFLNILPRPADPRFWYAFLRGPVSLLLGLALAVASIRILNHQRNALHWLRWTETSALACYSLEIVLNLVADLLHVHPAQYTLDLYALTIFSGLQSLVYPTLVLMLSRNLEPHE